MRIQYASDLHLEFKENTRYLKEHPLEVAGDILVLAGDILLFGEKLMSEHPFWEWCSDHYAHTFIVPGNHEYYNRVDVLSTLTNFTYPLRKNVTYINNRSITLGDTEIFFTTLWSRISDDALAAVQMGMNDCRRIVFGDHLLLATDYARAHDKCFTWLKDALSKSTAPHKVVVTHHCPIIAEDPRYDDNGLSSAFVVDLEVFIKKSNIDYWIFGHTHWNAKRGTRVGNTTLLTNQMGYLTHGGEEGFNLNEMIEVG
ncbi:MAG: metallophosphoesterase [Muribaculaceae bacterium]|nr:metallophosphoesterase [Muribaculaceae bacterium]